MFEHALPFFSPVRRLQHALRAAQNLGQPVRRHSALSDAGRSVCGKAVVHQPMVAAGPKSVAILRSTSADLFQIAGALQMLLNVMPAR